MGGMIVQEKTKIVEKILKILNFKNNLLWYFN